MLRTKIQQSTSGLTSLNNNIKNILNVPCRNKISYRDGNAYNKRWQYKWRHAYYTDPKDYLHTRVMRPEDSSSVAPIYGSIISDFMRRIFPGFRQVWERRHRLYDPFNVYLLPAFSLLNYQFYDVTFGFKLLTFIPLAVIYTRARDKTLDPDLKETYLREMIYSDPVISKYFNDNTIHVLDYDLEYVKGYLEPEKFPEYSNKVFRFFNTDTSQTEGFFKFGDVESGAVMNLKFKTMPAPGKFKFNVGEPFHIYDLRADIMHKGVLTQVVLIDEAETLKKTRPFLYLVQVMEYIILAIHFFCQLVISTNKTLLYTHKK